MLNKTDILGVGITTDNEDRILEFVLAELQKPKKDRKKIVIFTPNPEQISRAAGNRELQNILNSADVALPDGIGLVIGSQFVAKPGERIKARIAGVDFMKNLVKSVSKQPIKTGYLGGEPHVAEDAANCLKKMSPGLSIGYASGAYDKEKMIEFDIDILFVGLGFPKQEKWIMEHKNEIPATIFMAVGGSLDFLSGRIVRAPLLIRQIGLEWLFRLIIQPWRFFRQLRLLHFSALILVRALGSRLEKILVTRN